MFKRSERAFEAGYEKGFNDAIEMVKQIIRNKAAEEREEDGCLKWEDMRNGGPVTN